MISVTSSGSWNNTKNFLRRMAHGDIFGGLDKYGQQGVDALSNATPRGSGRTADSWRYRIIRNPNNPRIEWYNTNVHEGAVVAVLLQYGHGTKSGGFVQGRDYINPAVRPVFDRIAEDIWKEVKR